ncbi:predicted protein [Histoplasma capsulatum G186AR]|uniref:Uncharacterized protein n=2 Tax=Ajellomyces capsulatus TaxID=5037 RepID=C0NKY3_AJECG|nr:uncharacterized protein HCBG_03813 [Histoplasma capsulatum G186AR]EEH08524.1 predicted protein [Histoplasma capsulatum G186AR]KAG5299164.1 hypothetical protein I7I52_09379 [Histoplasma capsulatum]QSS68216.1 hypothetical protein I7I50_07549 [Histoplasma capsulatum G186AR]
MSGQPALTIWALDEKPQSSRGAYRPCGEGDWWEIHPFHSQRSSPSLVRLRAERGGKLLRRGAFAVEATAGVIGDWNPVQRRHWRAACKFKNSLLLNANRERRRVQVD